jgi:hypothetical protein
MKNDKRKEVQEGEENEVATDSVTKTRILSVSSSFSDLFNNINIKFTKTLRKLGGKGNEEWAHSEFDRLEIAHKNDGGKNFSVFPTQNNIQENNTVYRRYNPEGPLCTSTPIKRVENIDDVRDNNGFMLRSHQKARFSMDWFNIIIFMFRSFNVIFFSLRDSLLLWKRSQV